jgi:hypothetical protein
MMYGEQLSRLGGLGHFFGLGHLGHLWGLGIEGAWLAMESLLDSLRPTQLLNALMVLCLIALYKLVRELTLRQLLVLWTVGAGSILLWVSCAIALHRAGM